LIFTIKHSNQVLNQAF